MQIQFILIFEDKEQLFTYKILMFATKIYKNHIYGDIYTFFFSFSMQTTLTWTHQQTDTRNTGKNSFTFLFVKFLFTSKIIFCTSSSYKQIYMHMRIKWQSWKQ